MRQGLAIALLICLPVPAHAHLVGMEFGEFYAGALHLLVTPEHVVLLLALALMSGLRPREEARWILAALPLGFALGALAGTLGAAEISAVVLGASLAVTGLCAALALPLKAAAMAGLAATVAALHGYANMLPALGSAQIWLYALGVVAAGTATGTLLIAVLSALAGRTSWLSTAYRVVAGWIVAVGTLYAALTAVQV